MKVLLVLRKRWTMLFPDEKERGRSEMVKHIPGLLKHLRKADNDSDFFGSPFSNSFKLLLCP